MNPDDTPKTKNQISVTYFTRENAQNHPKVSTVSKEND